jgi:hypothetical protein
LSDGCGQLSGFSGRGFGSDRRPIGEWGRIHEYEGAFRRVGDNQEILRLLH